MSKKRPSSQKHNALMSFSLHFSWKNSSCHSHIWSKKRRFCQSYTILWPKKVNRIPFFLIFRTKITALIPIFCKKKNAYSLKTNCCLVIFFPLFHEKFPAAMPIFGLENVNSVKRTYYGPKKSMGCPFSPNFIEK